MMSVLNWAMRHQIPAMVVSDPDALAVIQPAMLPACVMLFSSANNAFEVSGVEAAAHPFYPCCCITVRFAIVSATLSATPKGQTGWVQGALLGSGDATYCSKCYIPAALVAVVLLWRALQDHGGLQAIWWALAAYYTVLMAAFASRMLIPGLNGPLRLLGSSIPEKPNLAPTPISKAN